MTNPEAPDPIDAAIAATNPEEQAMADDGVRALVHDVTFPETGKRIRLVVPWEFGPDEFESAVAMLMELRIHSEQARAREAAGPLIVPEAPKLVGLDGKAITP